MKKTLALILSLVMVFALVACGNAAAPAEAPAQASNSTSGTSGSASGADTKPAEVITLAANHQDSESSIFQYGFEEIKKALEEVSGGTMTITIYANGQLGNLQESMNGLREGTMDIGSISYSALSTYAPSMSVLDLPFLWDSAEHADKAFDGELGDFFAEELKASNLICADWFSQGFRMVTANKTIASLDDFKNLKIRVMNSDVYMKMFTLLGAAPMALDYSELFTALQQGTVDAQENPPLNILDASFNEVQSCLCETNHTYFGSGVVISPSTMNRLTDQQQAWLLEAIATGCKAERAACQQWNDDAVAKLVEAGMEKTSIPAEDLRAAVSSLYDEYPQFADLFDIIDSYR